MTANDVSNLKACLRLITEIRSGSGKVWQTAAEGMTAKHGDEQKEKRFLSELKTMLDGVNGQIGELDQQLTSQQPISNPLPLGHSVYLSLDAAIDNIPVYNQLVSSYKWLDKAHEYAGVAAPLLSQNSLNRSYGKVTKNRRKITNTIHTGAPQALEELVSKITMMYADMKLKISRPNGTKLNALVEVSLGRVLKAVLIFKGLMIEWVVVKGFNEESTRLDGQVDVWAESKYEVFRRITHNANAAMLNFQFALYPELSVKTFATYLHSFNNLFTDRCRKCNSHLHNNVPPTWREFKTLEPFHEDCRP